MTLRLSALKLALSFTTTQPARPTVESVVAAAEGFYNFLVPAHDTEPDASAVKGGGGEPFRSDEEVRAEYLKNLPEESLPVGDQDKHVDPDEERIAHLKAHEAYLAAHEQSRREGYTAGYADGWENLIGQLRAAAVGHLNSDHQVTEHDAAEFLLATLDRMLSEEQ